MRSKQRIGREDPREDEGGKRQRVDSLPLIHQSLCGEALKMDHVVSIITLAVNLIRANGLNHRQFKSFLEKLSTEYGDLPCHRGVTAKPGKDAGKM